MRYRGRGLCVELAHEGEGWNGDYDEDDPEDTPLLRFWIEYETDAEAHGEELAGTSHCTQLSADADPKVIQQAAEYILNEMADAIESGASIKKTSERLSEVYEGQFEITGEATIKEDLS